VQKSVRGWLKAYNSTAPSSSTRSRLRSVILSLALQVVADAGDLLDRGIAHGIVPAVNGVRIVGHGGHGAPSRGAYPAGNKTCLRPVCILAAESVLCWWEGPMDIASVFEWFAQETANIAEQANELKRRETLNKLALLWAAAAAEHRTTNEHAHGPAARRGYPSDERCDALGLAARNDQPR
jgi:hypothetical protein